MVCNSTIFKVLNLIGQDGSKILWPELKVPQCYQGFTMTEINRAGLELGYALTPLQLTDHYWAASDVPPVPSNLSRQYIDTLLYNHDAILLGQGKNNGNHAVAWDHEIRVVLDPNGLVYPLHSSHFMLDVILIVQKIGKHQDD